MSAFTITNLMIGLLCLLTAGATGALLTSSGTSGTLSLPRRAYRAIIGDLLDLVLAQPHQLLLSTGSVSLMAQFAAHSGIVVPAVGWCIAGGVEWAYLRGLASNAKAPTVWGPILNWSAFGIVVLWGILWVAIRLGAVATEHATGAGAWWLAAAHVVPVAWLSLCAAMGHSASATVEVAEAHQRELARESHQREIQTQQEEAARRVQEQEAALALDVQRQRAALALQHEEEQHKMERWEAAQAIKQRVRAMQMPPAPVQSGAMQEAAPTCPNCGASVNPASLYRVRKRGYCKQCQPKKGV